MVHSIPAAQSWDGAETGQHGVNNACQQNEDGITFFPGCPLHPGPGSSSALGSLQASKSRLHALGLMLLIFAVGFGY